MSVEVNSLLDDSWPLQRGVTMTILDNPRRVRVYATGEPGSEAFEVQPHWHAAHDEHIVVIKGRIQVTQDGVPKIIGPEDGVSIVPRRVVHSIKCFPGEELIVEETAMPSGETTEQKILFFRNLFAPGVIQSFFRTMQVFYYGDAYLKFPAGFRWLESIFIVVVGGWLPTLFGLQLPDKRLRFDPEHFPRSKKD